MPSAVTIQMKDETLAALDAYAHRIDQPRDLLVMQAVEDLLSEQSRQLERIDAGIADADAGNFASDEEVAAVFVQYGVSYRAAR